MSNLAPGTQLMAPEGFKNLRKDVIYYFLRSSPKTLQVSLLELRERPAVLRKFKSRTRPERLVTPEPLPVLHILGREDFESALGKIIIPCDSQCLLPPWLADLEGKNLVTPTKRRRAPKRSHNDRIDRRLNVIAPLVEDVHRILDAPDPNLEINRHIRYEHPAVNPARARLWFYCFIAFGQERTALHFATSRIGTWDRTTSEKTEKRGKPNRNGKRHGHNVDSEMKKKIKKGYRAHYRLGKGLTAIYIDVVRSKLFGCVCCETKKGRYLIKTLVQPDGLPFPSFEQFRYHVNKIFGLRNVQKELHGATASRSHLEPTVGSFSADVCNMLQRVESDAYNVKELPRGYIEGSTLPPLVTARSIDLATSEIVGVGFSQGSERSCAYSEAKFCMGADKVVFCRLHGLQIRATQWSTKGLPASEKTDRGPGVSNLAQGRGSNLRAGERSAPPSFAAQSKATIESSNPRTRHNNEPPSYIQSDLHTIELARKQLLEIIRFNDSRDVSGKVPPDLLGHLERPTPVALARLLSERGRSDGRQVPFDDLVRTYLRKCSAKLSRKGVEVAGRMYRSRDLTESGACATLTENQTIGIEAYYLGATTRHVWIDWRGWLVQLDVLYPLMMHESVLYMSFEEAMQCAQDQKVWRSEIRNHRISVAVETRNEEERQTGMPASSGTRRAGRPKRGTATARREAAEARDVVGGRC
jgi:hypothetical protein